MSNVRFQFRIYPTAEQERVLARVFGCCGYVANRAIEMRSEAWKNDKVHCGYEKTSAELVNWKKEKAWLREVSSVPIQQSLRHVDSAFSRFFKKLAKYPRFKKRSHQPPAGQFRIDSVVAVSVSAGIPSKCPSAKDFRRRAARARENNNSFLAEVWAAAARGAKPHSRVGGVGQLS